MGVYSDTRSKRTVNANVEKVIFIWAYVVLLYVKMVDTDEIEGPTLVWTFPLVTRFQTGGGLLNFRQTASGMSEKVDDVREDQPVRSKVTNTLTSSEYNNQEQEDDSSDIEEELDELASQSEEIFGDQEYGQSNESSLVEIEEGVFVPLRTSIDQGESVEWVNEDDSVHRVLSTNNEDFDSGQLEPGESFTYTFNEEEVVKFIDTIEGGDVMCGAVIVGDTELNESLRCEEDPNRVLTDEDDSTEDSGMDRTMSQAATEKQDMDTGFNA